MATIGLTADLAAGVKGRYVRLEAPISLRMELHEIEVYADGQNIVTGQPEVSAYGAAGPISRLIDGMYPGAEGWGRKHYDHRSQRLEAPNGINPFVELDLGEMREIDRIVIHQAGAWADRYLRLVTVLDAERRVVFLDKFDVRAPAYRQGMIEIPITPYSGQFAGKWVREGAEQWMPLGEFIGRQQIPPPPNSEERAAAFAQRNSPAEIEKLAKRFFALVNLDKPGLENVAIAYKEGRYQDALDAFKFRFFDKIRDMINTWPHALPTRQYDLEHEDLLDGIKVSLPRGRALATPFTPGIINWAHLPEDTTERGDAVAAIREWAMANNFQRVLLTAYRETGNPAYINRWAEITDDWAMHFFDDIDRHPAENLRHYFGKEPLQTFNFFCYEMDRTFQVHPDRYRGFPGLLSSATLARMLMRVVEEYPPAYWRDARKTVYNHTYNALNAAYHTARILDDFHAGERLGREVQRHYERIWVYGISADGSMMEIGDEGHLTMHMRIAANYLHMLKDRPKWFTKEFQTRFRDGYDTTTRYIIRHMTPQGNAHRTALGDHFGAIWNITREVRQFGGGFPQPMYTPHETFAHPEVRAILDTVYGRGRNRGELDRHRQSAYDLITLYYSEPYQGKPSMVSDWMPYAGLHYLRRDWSPDASFMHILSQATDAQSSGASQNNTQYRFHDFGYPLVHAQSLTIDGRSQHPDYERQTLYPGSKTDRLTQAPEKPIPARWLTSDRYDLAETFYHGAYQNVAVRWAEKTLVASGDPVTDITATRQFLQIRPLRAFIVTDRIAHDANEPQSHTYEIDYGLYQSRMDDKTKMTPVDANGSAGRIELDNPQTAGLTMLHFGAPVTYANTRPSRWVPTGTRGGTLAAVDFNLHGLRCRWQAEGDAALVTLLLPKSGNQDTRLEEIKDIGDPQRGIVGFSATIRDQGSIAYLTTDKGRENLQLGEVQAHAEALLLTMVGETVTGIVLDADSLVVNGRSVTLPSSCFEFELRDGQVAGITPIHQPIDPVTFSPNQQAFVDQVSVEMTSATPDVDIFYTLDGSNPTPDSARYAAPIKVDRDTFIKARAIRRSWLEKGNRTLPFTVAGTDVSRVSYGHFERQDFRAPVTPDAETAQGLAWEYVEGNWLRLYSHLHLPEALPAAASGTTRELLDVSMRQTDNTFGVRYTGYLAIPEKDVYTFHAPEEFAKNICEPGYDLRLWIDGEEWYPGQQWHGLGGWSIPLEPGLHEFKVTFADARARNIETQPIYLWRGYPTPWVVWRGEAPVIRISGTNTEKQPIPNAWLQH